MYFVYCVLKLITCKIYAVLLLRPVLQLISNVNTDFLAKQFSNIFQNGIVLVFTIFCSLNAKNVSTVIFKINVIGYYLIFDIDLTSTPLLILSK